MAVTLPNLDRIAKDDPKLGEALQKAQSYINQNTTAATGNRLPAPPIDPTRPPG